MITSEVDPATGELDAFEADLTAGEFGTLEADLTAGELGSAKIRCPTGEPGTGHREDRVRQSRSALPCAQPTAAHAREPTVARAAHAAQDIRRLSCDRVTQHLRLVRNFAPRES